MSGRTPVETAGQLIEAMNNRDVERAVSMYEPGGALVRGTGEVAIGAEALRDAFEVTTARGPTVTTKSYKVIESGDIALYCSD